MASFVIESFGNGLDLRKSATTAVPGSLRVLRNAYINEGGAIEKRKRFQERQALTNYAQSSDYLGRVTGPHPISGAVESVMFIHHHDSVPVGGNWASGSGSIAKYHEISSAVGRPLVAWAAKTTVTLNDFGGLLHQGSYSQFAEFSYVYATWFDGSTFFHRAKLLEVEHTGDEPTTISHISSEQDLRYQATFRQKGYTIGRTFLKISAVDDPGDAAGTGSGEIDLRVQGQSIGQARALAEYFGQLAIVGLRGVQFWQMDADPDQNQYLRTVPISLVAPRSVTPYAYGDILFLGNYGIRSLRAQDSSNVAFVTDVGSPIDSLIRRELEFGDATTEDFSHLVATDVSNGALYRLAIGVVHPGTGQFWLCLKDKIYVLSDYRDAKVRAWSVYDLPENENADHPQYAGGGTIPEKYEWVADICPIGMEMIFRTFADRVFIYGGPDGSAYDSSEVEVVTPYMDMGSPQTIKTLHSLDIDCEGEWTVELAIVPSIDPAKDPDLVTWHTLGTVDGGTHVIGDGVGIDIASTHFALRLTSTSSMAAKVSQVTIHYTGGDEK